MTEAPRVVVKRLPGVHAQHPVDGLHARQPGSAPKQWRVADVDPDESHIYSVAAGGKVVPSRFVDQTGLLPFYTGGLSPVEEIPAERALVPVVESRQKIIVSEAEAQKIVAEELAAKEETKRLRDEGLRQARLAVKPLVDAEAERISKLSASAYSDCSSDWKYWETHSPLAWLGKLLCPRPGVKQDELLYSLYETARNIRGLFQWSEIAQHEMDDQSNRIVGRLRRDLLKRAIGTK